MHANMNIFERVKKLGFPTGEYVIIGSGILAALGIRDANDIDVAVTPSLLKTLKDTGNWKEEIKWGKLFLVGDKVDVATQLNWEDYKTTTEEAINTATVINGIPFLNIKETILFKKALGREKDFKDIELLEKNQKTFSKITYIGKVVTVKIDRPMGSKHPKFDCKYPINYGFVPGTKMADGKELDVYVLGVSEPLKEFTGKCVAIIHRTNDDDDKLVLVTGGLNPTDDHIRSATDFQEKFFQSEIIRR